jgi:hypothetical protein
VRRLAEPFYRVVILSSITLALGIVSLLNDRDKKRTCVTDISTKLAARWFQTGDEGSKYLRPEVELFGCCKSLVVV